MDNPEPQGAALQGSVETGSANGDENWAVPEAWIGEQVLVATRGSLLVTSEGLTLHREPGELQADLGTSIVLQVQAGEIGTAEICIPKCCIHNIMKVGRVQPVGGMPPLNFKQ